MDDFVNQINRQWVEEDAMTLCSYALWRLNFIHPFINGNGRTARALCFFVFSVKNGGFINCEKPLPVLIKENKYECEQALRECDKKFLQGEGGFEPITENLGPMIEFLSPLVVKMLKN